MGKEVYLLGGVMEIAWGAIAVLFLDLQSEYVQFVQFVKIRWAVNLYLSYLDEILH